MCHYYKKPMMFVFSKDFVNLLIAMAVMLPIYWHMLWASHVSYKTVLIKTFPEFTIYISIGVILGIILAVRATFLRPVSKAAKQIFYMFLAGFCFGFVSTLHIFDIYVYLFPDKVINYASDYDVVVPGPPRGKNGHCEIGLWIKDVHTDRWIQLCTNERALQKKRKQGMDEVWVTARVNKLGTYIVDYQFNYK